jgi:hypothetical protein
VSTERDLWPVLYLEENILMLALWDEVVGYYTRRHISKASDRLPALSGIAGAFGSTGAHGTYQAGLWETWFVPSLLWHIDTVPGSEIPAPFTEEDLERPLAPSWSWAKFRGAWMYKRKVFHGGLVAEMLQSELVLVSDDRFGAVKKGVVTLLGLIATASLTYTPSDPTLPYADRFRQQNIELTKYAESQRAVMLADFLLDDLIGEDEKVVCLGLQTNIFDGFGLVNNCASVYGIVLMAVEGEVGMYRRIGFFSAPVSWYKGYEKSVVRIC